MATPTTVYISPQQRKRLFARARRRKTSFSEELRTAVDLYLDEPEDFSREELELLAGEAKASAERSVARLDAMISRVNETVQHLDEFQRRIDGIK
ncbi:MAG TPA: hypothetical protein VL523_05455 [Terriglobia bacterium]|nr:hypothetical protein [Terriglobia bacterium]